MGHSNTTPLQKERGRGGGRREGEGQRERWGGGGGGGGRRERASQVAEEAEWLFVTNGDPDIYRLLFRKVGVKEGFDLPPRLSPSLLLYVGRYSVTNSVFSDSHSDYTVRRPLLGN